MRISEMIFIQSPSIKYVFSAAVVCGQRPHTTALLHIRIILCYREVGYREVPNLL